MSLGSPSFATKTLVPSEVKVSISGREPTVTEPSGFPLVSKKPTRPGSCLLLASTATATIPFLTATLLAPAPKAEISIVLILVGLLGLLISRISTPDPVVTNKRRDIGS